MKKLSLILGSLGVLGLVLAFSIPQLVTSQTEAPPTTAKPSVDRLQLQMEIGLLRLINEMGLSRDQITSLKEIISELRTSQETVLQAQQELRDFLVRYQGSREDFAQAVKPFDEKIAQAREAFDQKLSASIEKAKDLLTLKQAEILRQFMRERIAQHFRQRVQQQEQPCRYESMTPKEPTKMELRIDIHKPFDGEFFKRLRDRIEEWLDRWGIDLDSESFERMQNQLDRTDRMSPMMSWRYGQTERPMLRMMCERLGPDLMIRHELLGRFLMNHLDVLEKVLNEKLQQISSTRI